MEVFLKQITLPEAHDVVDLFDQYRVFYKQRSDINLAKRFITERLENHESIIFVAYNSDKPIGFTQLYPKYSSARATKNWILNDLYVDENHRGKGVARALIKESMTFAKSSSAIFLQIQTASDNFPAQKLYEFIGFQKQAADDTFFLYKITV